jgi:hypothetical protein
MGAGLLEEIARFGGQAGPDPFGPGTAQRKQVRLVQDVKADEEVVAC